MLNFVHSIDIFTRFSCFVLRLNEITFALKAQHRLPVRKRLTNGGGWDLFFYNKHRESGCNETPGRRG